MLVVRSEDLFADSRQTLAEMLSFVGLPAWNPKSVQRSKKKRTAEPISLGTRKWLEEFFEPHNRRLYELLGRDSGW